MNEKSRAGNGANGLPSHGFGYNKHRGKMNIIHQHNVKVTPWPIADQSVQTIVTSPPYWALRDYGHPDQIGMEKTPEEFVQVMVNVFREAWRVLKNDGTLWLNLGDTYYGGKGTNGASVAYSGAGNTLNKRALITTKPGVARPQDMPIPGLKPKDLVGIPWMVAFALRADGWYLRQDIIWSKPNPMPESVTDRCTKAHEYLFLLSKSRQYYFDTNSIREPMAASSVSRLSQNIDGQIGSNRIPGKTNGTMKAVQAKGNRKTFRGGGVYTKGQSFDNSSAADNNSMGNVINETGLRNKRSVWTVATEGFSEAHFATFPEKLITDCIKAGSQPGDIVLDPFMGAGTVAMQAMALGRQYVGLELNPDYINIANRRIKKAYGLFAQNANGK